MSAYCVRKQKCCIMHPFGEQLLMMSKHEWPMLTELCLLLILHDWKAMAGGDSTHAAYAVNVMANTFQDVGMVEQTANVLQLYCWINSG